MAERVPFPPPGFEALSIHEQVTYLESLRNRLAALSQTTPIPDSLGTTPEKRGTNPVDDLNDRDGVIREHSAIDALLRLAAVVDASDEAVVAKSLDGLIESWNPAAEHIFGFTAEEAIGQPVTMLIPWDRREEENQILEKVKQGKQVHLETIRLTKTGERINASLTVTPVRDATGKLIGATKLLRDISDQKRAHQALSRLSRKLITAQEEERARIARELHDDICQRLTVVAIGLAGVADSPPGSLNVQTRASDLQRQVSEIARDVQALSHDLHSSKLALLGIAASVRLFCEDFARQRNVRVAVDAGELTRRIAPTVSLTLFRILQEALHNSVKHGEARQCGVRLWQADGWINLTVDDDGVGFDVEVARRGNGFGLISMEERTSLVDGVLSVTSEPTRGTSIRVRVPLLPDQAEGVS
jgi:PAS domain S-box-containing protein